MTDRFAAGSPTIHSDGRAVPARRLHESARAVAARLRADGVESGDRILLMMKNSTEFLGASLGIMLAGGVLVPVNVRFTASEIAELMALSQPRAWIGDSKSTPQLRDAQGADIACAGYEISPDGTGMELLGWGNGSEATTPLVLINPHDHAAVFFTAGTTGKPKGALTSHAALAAFVDVAEDGIGLTAADTVIMPMPMFYTGGFKASLAALLLGANLVTMQDWRPADLVEAMHEYHGTVLWGVPSVWALMIRSSGFDAAKVQTLRILWRGGSLTPKSLIDDLVRVFPGLPHYQSYGLTECNVSSMERDAIGTSESCGYPTRGTSLTIDGHTRRQVTGEIWVRGTQQFSGYLGNPEATSATLQKGWVHTGDQGWLDDEGRLRVIGRGSDILIRGGENISTAEVERAILNIDGVAEVAVVGVPDDVFGHELKAYVVGLEGTKLTAEFITQGCARVLAEFKVPRYVEVRTKPLPKSPSGKVRKAEL